MTFQKLVLFDYFRHFCLYFLLIKLVNILHLFLVHVNLIYFFFNFPFLVYQIVFLLRDFINLIL